MFRILIVALVVSLFGMNSAWAKEGPAKTDLSPYKGSKKLVPFSHQTHSAAKIAKIDCKTCHHQAKDKKLEVKCGECHKKEKSDKTPDFKTAFHKQCIGCHQKPGANTKAPTKCKDCHKL